VTPAPAGRTGTGPTALLTDHYELTMLAAALRDGTAQRRCVFEVFARRLPPGRRYGVVAGTARLVEAIQRFRFDPDALAYLTTIPALSDPATQDWLAAYRFGGDVHGYAEGECYVPGSPILVVEGTFAEAVVLETLVLSVLNHDCAIAAAASRMVAAAAGRPCLEMGARRTHELAAVDAARAAYVAGFTATSNLEAGHRYGIPTVGTAAHAFTLVHDDERAAFASQVATLGADTALLVDTFDVEAAVETAVAVAGSGLGAVRLDSGDIAAQARAVRARLDALGAGGARIVATGDLDEYAIAALAREPIDTYGVGTALVTGSGAPAAGLVYKLVAREGRSGTLEPVAKCSPGKPTRGGRKRCWRALDADGFARAEIVAATDEGGAEGVPAAARPLMHRLVESGRAVESWPGEVGSLATARARHAASLAELPTSARDLSPGGPTIPTVHSWNEVSP
jgi:nicotinate phosphoribosyltransferase